MVFTSVDVLTPVPPRGRYMAPTVFLKASSVPKIWNDGVRSQRRRLADLFGAAADQDLFAAYCLGVEQQMGKDPPILIGTQSLTYRRNDTWNTQRLGYQPI